MDKAEPEYVFLKSEFQLGKVNKNGDVYTFENFSVLPSSIIIEHMVPKEDFEKMLRGEQKWAVSMECLFNG